MKYNVPSIKECYEIMRSRMPQHIIEHSTEVMRVASAITDNLKPEIKIDRGLVIASSLLHDITKSESLITKEHHEITGGIFMKKLGFPNVAEIIEEHVELKKYDLSGKLEEKEIVFYADKRVMHNKIVSIDERIADLLHRYGRNEQIIDMILKNKIIILDIEKKIQSCLIPGLDEITGKLIKE